MTQPRTVLSPGLLDRGIPPVFVPSEGTRLGRIWELEIFQLQIWNEFRRLTGRWPVTSIFVHHMSWVAAILSVVAGIFIGLRLGNLACVSVLGLGVICFVALRRVFGPVLLWEWRRARWGYRREGM